MSPHFGSLWVVAAAREGPETSSQPPAPRPPPTSTQLLAREWQEGRVLVQVLVEVDAQKTQLLLDALDFLQGGAQL